MTANLDNFVAIFSEGLTAEQRERLASNGDELGFDVGIIWDLILSIHVRVVIEQSGFFIRTGDKMLMNDKSFNDLFNPIVNQLPDLPARYRDNAVKLAMATTQMKRATGATYEPGKGNWIGTKFNMWRGPSIVPLEEKPEIFLEHLRYLIPDRREAQLLIDYLKWMVQHPDKKMSFALLIVGRYGTGKSWFAKLLTSLFGQQNVLVIEKGTNVADKFNAEQANRQVIFVDELVPDGKLSVAQSIAPMIVAPKLHIERKGIDKCWVPNRFNVVAVSNFDNAIKINGRQDRKWLIVRATDDLFGSDDKNRPTRATTDYYNRLHAMTPGDDGMVTDEVRRVLWWLQSRPISADFNGQGVAPETTAKNDVAEATESTIESEIFAAYVDKRGPFKFELFTVHDVREDVVSFDLTKRSLKSYEGEVSAAMIAAGARKIGNVQVYLPGHHHPRRMWCFHKGLLRKYEKMTAEQLKGCYLTERLGYKTNDAGKVDRSEFEFEEAVTA